MVHSGCQIHPIGQLIYDVIVCEAKFVSSTINALLKEQTDILTVANALC